MNCDTPPYVISCEEHCAAVVEDKCVVYTPSDSGPGTCKEVDEGWKYFLSSDALSIRDPREVPVSMLGDAAPFTCSAFEVIDIITTPPCEDLPGMAEDDCKGGKYTVLGDNGQFEDSMKSCCCKTGASGCPGVVCPVKCGNGTTEKDGVDGKPGTDDDQECDFGFKNGTTEIREDAGVKYACSTKCKGIFCSAGETLEEYEKDGIKKLACVCKNDDECFDGNNCTEDRCIGDPKRCDYSEIKQRCGCQPNPDAWCEGRGARSIFWGERQLAFVW